MFRLFAWNEFLNAFTVMSLTSIQIALRVDSDAVHRQKLTRITSAASDTADFGEVIAEQDPHFLIHAVRNKDVTLLRIIG